MVDVMLLRMFADAVVALGEAEQRLRFADATLAMADGPCWDGSLVDRYTAARDEFVHAFEVVEAFVALTG